MLAKVLRDFPFSEDGVRAIQAVAGATVNIPDGLVDGLRSEGWISLDVAVLTVAEAEADLAAAENRLEHAKSERAKKSAQIEVDEARQALEAAREAV